ncbi:MAG: DUF4199 domain-containing protein [Chitinophagaceae bacterium]|nr:DUF4199 domain-containing protein [Chitinophagaceae bacterium]MBK7307705.1 DUF4199 domain-containing protein [Chitinophagaceae bacterium]MBK9486384.1 DUF4199 domain-containing protein [Chitinophagaceae bacterium]
MKKIVIVNGIIAGLIVAAMFLITMGLYHNQGNFEGGMWIGYASMLLAFSLIFVAIIRFRDKYNNGVISFGKAFRIGLYITLIASTIYVVAWLIDFYVFIPDFADKYAAHMLEKLKSNGASAAEITSTTQQMDSFKEMYKNPVLVVLFTYIEILPVGLLLSLIAALVLKRKVKPAI